MDRTTPLAQLRAGRGATEGQRARAERRALEQDLASYTSTTDRAELDAILSRHSEEETAEIRRILGRTAA
jgi:hypothetical protein